MNRISVEDYLLADGIPTSIRGFGYLADAIMMCHRNIGITGEIYPEIARENNTTPTGVERNIRNAISKSISTDHIKNSEYISYAHLMLSRQEGV